jgi:predicted acylesterase/phospholipase RssA
MNYPFELQRREAAAIRARREKAAQSAVSHDPAPSPEEAESRHKGALPPGAHRDQLPPRTVGLALSGGGIRSATFSLGVLQALAKKGRLRHIDYLSTVSGGGYTGSFLGRLFTRNAIAALAANKADPCGRVESILANDASPQLDWLRRNANYLVATGGSDVRQHLALIWRNLVTIYLILALLGLALFGLLLLAGDRIAAIAPIAAPPAALVALGPAGALSAWWWLPLAALGVAVFPCAVAFWLAPKQDSRASFSFFPLAAWITLLAFLGLAAGYPAALAAFTILLLSAAWLEIARRRLPPHLDPSTGESSSDPGTVIRNRLTRGLGEALVLLLVCVLWPFLDTVARAFALGHLQRLIAAWTLLLAPLTPFLRQMAAFLRSSAAKKKGGARQPGFFGSPAVRAGIIAFPIAGLLIVLLDAAVHWLFNRHGGWGCAALLLGAALSVIFGRAFDFLNFSALQEAYGARISRTFLGASNPARIFADPSGEGCDVQLVHPDDDIAFDQYHPEANGGPLHLISMCVNETIDAASQRGVPERKGLPMCVGPCGVSVSRKFHATWAPPPPAAALPWWTRLRRFLDGRIPPIPGARVALRPIPVPGELFHVFQGPAGWPAFVESLRLSRWIATSGAAVGTGSGRTTSLPISLLLGLVDIRLGYWWDSGINAKDRPGRFPWGVWRKLKALPAALVKMQSLLISDFLGCFEGPSHRFWNISDGGHFDNTAIYELIRRRVPFIIAVDGSEDVSFTFDDMAELVRQVRIDFGAEVVFVDPASKTAQPPKWILDWLSNYPKMLGSLPDIGERGAPKASKSPRSIKSKRKHAALAHVTYDGADEPATWIILLKASVTGDESLDITNYKENNPAFPSEPTTEQFFNEAQWESYRALGEHIGNIIISQTLQN